MRFSTKDFNPASYFFCPARLFTLPSPDWRQVEELYREAYEQAQAVHRPAITDRLWAVSCN